MDVLLAVWNRLDALVEQPGFRDTDGLQELRPGGLRPRDDVQRRLPQCDGIWRPPDGRVVLRADRLQQHLVRRHPEHEAERAVAVVR